jgi:hypothetical protein
MHVVPGTADQQKLTAQVSNDTSKVREKLWLEFVIQKRPALLCAEQCVNQQIRERVGHFSRPSRGSSASSFLLPLFPSASALGHLLAPLPGRAEETVRLF